MGKDFIAGAIQRPGALRKKLGAKKGKNIPVAKIKKAAKAKGTLGREARLAITLKKLSKRRKKK